MTSTVEEQEPDYTYALGQEPTSLQRRFADFLLSEEVGYDVSKAKTKEEAFREGVRMAVQLRIPFQSSATNRSATEEERLQRQAERERANAEKETARASKAAKATAEKAGDDSEPTKRAAVKPKAAPSATPAAAPAPKRAPAARRAPARAAATTGDAPF